MVRCSHNDITHFKDGLYIRAATGVVSLIASIAAIAIVLLFRRFKPEFLRVISTTEKLILLVAGLAIFRSLSEIFQISNLDFLLNVNTYGFRTKPYHEGLCQASAFFTHWSFGCMLLGIQVLLLHLVLQLTVGVEFTRRSVTQIVYILSPILLPLVCSSYVPFTTTSFGLGKGGWCWISDYTLSDCANQVKYELSLDAKIKRYVFWIGPFIVFLFVDLCIIVVVYPVLLCKVTGLSPDDRKSLAKQHVPILCMISVSMICNALAVFDDFESTLPSKSFDDHNVNFSLFVMHALASSLWGVVIMISVIFYILALRYSQQPYEGYDDIDRSHLHDQREYMVASDGSVAPSLASGILTDHEDLLDSYIQ